MSRYNLKQIIKAFFIQNQISHATNLITKHPLDFVAHGFPAGGAEMDFNPVGGLTDFLHQCGALVLLRSHRNRTVGSVYIDNLFIAHQ